MRTGHNKQRNRNRHRSSGGGGGGGGSGGGNPLSRIYESNGPDVKVRGTAQTIAEKYLQLGRDAQVSGDYVMGESYFQFAEHYLRIVSAAQAYNQQMQPQFRRPDDDSDEDGDDDGSDTTAQDPRSAPQPMMEQPSMSAGEQPRDGDGERQPQQQVYRQPRDNRDQRDQQGGQRDQSGSRDQNNQSYGNRDRNKSRWQDRRDGNRDGQDQRNAPQPLQHARTMDEPAREQSSSQPAPAMADSVADSGQWEAPSFLRRPAVMPQPVAEPETVVEAPAAAAAPAPRKYVRKPRKEATADAPAAEPATTESSAD